MWSGDTQNPSNNQSKPTQDAHAKASQHQHNPPPPPTKPTEYQHKTLPKPIRTPHKTLGKAHTKPIQHLHKTHANTMQHPSQHPHETQTRSPNTQQNPPIPAPTTKHGPGNRPTQKPHKNPEPSHTHAKPTKILVPPDSRQMLLLFLFLLSSLAPWSSFMLSGSTQSCRQSPSLLCGGQLHAFKATTRRGVPGGFKETNRCLFPGAWLPLIVTDLNKARR